MAEKQKILRILVVDDSPEDREIYRRLLLEKMDYEYEIIETDTGGEGLTACRSENPDCILLDYNLPDMTGLEFLKRVANDKGEILLPIVMIAGMANEYIAVEALKRGAQDYLVKDILVSEALFRAINNALQKTELHRLVEQQRVELEQKVIELQEALEHVKQLQGLLPICAWCKKIRNNDDTWQQMEDYITQQSEAEFTHSICSECYKKQQDELAREKQDERKYRA